MAPIVPIKVFAGRRWRTVWAYVDSGAAVSILTVPEAKRLGLLKIKARKVAITTSGGLTNRISLHRLWVKLNKKRFSSAPTLGEAEQETLFDHLRSASWL